MDSPEMFKKVELLVENEFADEILNKGMAELVFRRTDQKFRSMVKCSIFNNAEENVAEKLLEALSDPVGGETANVSKLYRTIRQMNLKGALLPGADFDIKNVASTVEKLLFRFPKLSSMKFLNLGLSMANIMVSTAGFALINDKLKDLSQEMDYLKDEMQSLQDLNFAVHIKQPAEKLVVHYGYYCDWMRQGKEISVSELEQYLESFNPFLSTIIGLSMKPKLKKEHILNILFMLLPVYTTVLKMYLKAFYFANKESPSNYERFLNVYQELNDSAFSAMLLDQYFLTGKLSYKETIQLLGSNSVGLFYERLQIDDLLRIMAAFESEEEFMEFDHKLDEIAEKEIKSRVRTVSKRSGVSVRECKRVLEVS